MNASIQLSSNQLNGSTCGKKKKKMILCVGNALKNLWKVN